MLGTVGDRAKLGDSAGAPCRDGGERRLATGRALYRGLQLMRPAIDLDTRTRARTSARLAHADGGLPQMRGDRGSASGQRGASPLSRDVTAVAWDARDASSNRSGLVGLPLQFRCRTRLGGRVLTDESPASTRPSPARP